MLLERLGEQDGHTARFQADDSASVIAVAYAAESLAEIEAAPRRLDADTRPKPRLSCDEIKRWAGEHARDHGATLRRAVTQRDRLALGSLT